MRDTIFSVFPNENFIDLGLYKFGLERCESEQSFGLAKKDHYLFHYIISGTGTFIAENSKGTPQIYPLKSMQGFMIFPDKITSYIADKDSPWEYIWIEFDGLRVKSILESAGLTPDSPIYHARFKELREEMVNEMLYITKHGFLSPFHLIGHLYLFLDYLIRSSSSLKITRGSQLRDFYIQKALAFIDDNFQNDISIEGISEYCGLNICYFGRIFKQAIGQTPQEYLINYRMLKAVELLKLTDLSVDEVGKAVGYENQLNFFRAFKNVYNISPKYWRNQHKSHNEKQ